MSQLTDISELLSKINDYNDGSIRTITFISYIILVISWWIIFRKANRYGFESLIPIYNLYVICKITKYSFLTIFIGLLMILIPFIGIIISLFIMLYTYLALNHRLAKCFGHGLLFTIGLILFPHLFLLIIAFSNDKYRQI